MNDAPTLDYRRTKAAALQALAAGGDLAAARELERRGVAVAALDVTQLDDAALRQLVSRWADGVTPDERAQHRALAERAHAELDVRYRVDSRRWDGTGDAPQPPLPAPWLRPARQRTQAWRRPQSSTLYPSETAITRAAIGALARDVYRARNQ